ncbi:MAG TPA: VWA domain-containing protein [Kiritimatiellia bacterium]|nr:VWA domain-containing protein [Kiritimatiellia bacterium]HMO98615.1 VWA domain-containing protein [Kiritimatiellia bacterium]HMP96357.1 VWA domain-containing protein [Kiritimatiellia bacterium]
MIFRYPWLLLLLLLVPVLVYLRYARSRRTGIRFSDAGVFARMGPSWAVLAQPVLPMFYGLGLVLAIIALARPQKGLEERSVRTEGIDIVLCVDLSTSMLAEDFSNRGRPMNRLEASKEVMERFINSRPHDRIGLVAFAALPFTMAPLSTDRGWLLQQIQRLEAGMLPDGTAIGTGLASAVNRLRDSEAKSQVIILLTDGVNNRGEITPLNAAKAAQALGIRVYTIGAGTDGISRVPIRDPFGGTRYVQQMSDVDEPTLKEIAAMTGGRYYRARDFEGLNAIYQEIDQLEKTEINIDQYRYFEERFMPFLGWAIGLLALEKLLALGRLGRLP